MTLRTFLGILAAVVLAAGFVGLYLIHVGAIGQG